MKGKSPDIACTPHSLNPDGCQCAHYSWWRTRCVFSNRPLDKNSWLWAYDPVELTVSVMSQLLYCSAPQILNHEQFKQLFEKLKKWEVMALMTAGCNVFSQDGCCRPLQSCACSVATASTTARCSRLCSLVLATTPTSSAATPPRRHVWWTRPETLVRWWNPFTR